VDIRVSSQRCVSLLLFRMDLPEAPCPRMRLDDSPNVIVGAEQVPGSTSKYGKNLCDLEEQYPRPASFPDTQDLAGIPEQGPEGLLNEGCPNSIVSL
jgi:hypothetical protein